MAGIPGSKWIDGGGGTTAVELVWLCRRRWCGNVGINSGSQAVDENENYFHFSSDKFSCSYETASLWSSCCWDIHRPWHVFSGRTWRGNSAIVCRPPSTMEISVWCYCTAAAWARNFSEPASMHIQAKCLPTVFLPKEPEEKFYSFSLQIRDFWFYQMLFLPSNSIISSICWISDLPGNSGLCVNSSPRIQPAAHMSMAVECVREPSSSSGARYHKVTTHGVITVSVLLNSRASPKSAILMRPLSVNSRFDTFRSRWMMNRECRYLRPSSNCSIRHFVCDSENGFGMLSSNEARSCSQYSIEMNMLSRLLPTTTSFSLTMFSWSHIFSIVISRKPLTGSPSFSWSMRTRFSATILPSFTVSRARSTRIEQTELLFPLPQCIEIRWHLSSYTRHRMCPLQCDSIFRIQSLAGIFPTEKQNQSIWIDRRIANNNKSKYWVTTSRSRISIGRLDTKHVRTPFRVIGAWGS